MKQTTIERFRKGGYYAYRVPDIIRTARGTLLVCYECRYGGDWSAMDLGLRRSTDGGATWSERMIAVPGGSNTVIHNGVMFADGDRVHLLWGRNYRETFYQYSLDDGLTWFDARNITDVLLPLREQYNWTVVAQGPGHGLVTAAGRLIVPVWLAANPANVTSHRPSVVTTLYSDDRGESWRCGDIIWGREDLVNPSESLLAELSDGSFMINCRHETGGDAREVGFSPDGIGNWGGFYLDKSLPDPVCAAGLTQAKERLWFVNCACARAEGRERLSVRMSADDGKTWPYKLQIAALGGYSDICIDPDAGMLYVVAETGRNEEGDMFSFDLTVTALSEQEVISGE